jgi:outer membrane protein OmpA-like peptidoglycan-associated protein
MPEPQRTLEDLARGIDVQTGRRHRLVAPRRTAVGRVVGAAFDTDKTFLKPGALRALRVIRDILRRERPFELLIVGHTDTVGTEGHNDRLSLARAESVKAFLNDDFQAWLDNYGSRQPEGSRWGDAEDQMMLFAMPNARERPSDEDPVRFFQRTHDLEPDGDLGPLTREQLVKEYMKLDGPPLSEEGPELKMTTHGCGEHFPLDESGRNVEQNAADNREDAMDRRVEVFLFSALTGIEPAPPGPNSRSSDPQYGEWRRRARVDHETVLIEGESDFFLRLNVPPERSSEVEESFKLFSLDGPFSVTKTASDAEQHGEFLDLVFTRVRTELAYSLEIMNGAGETYLLFENVPFSEIDGHVGEDSSIEGDPLAPEPEDEP